MLSRKRMGCFNKGLCLRSCSHEFQRRQLVDARVKNALRIICFVYIPKEIIQERLSPLA